MNPAATPEVAFRRSNDELKIRPGGETAPWCCDAEVKIVMRGGRWPAGVKSFILPFFDEKNYSRSSRAPKRGVRGMTNECPFTETVGDPSRGNHAGSLRVLLVDPAGARGNENLGLTTRQVGESAKLA